jgi:L-ribulose-5-phosphate 4-epimerase
MTLKVLRKDVCEANKDLGRRHLISLGMGCASGIDRERGVVVVKPSAIPYACLTPEDMLVVDLAGKVVEGALTPAPDVAAHLYLYQEFKAVGGIVNVFGSHATRFAQAERPIPCFGIIHARFFKGEIPVTRALRKPEIERNYERSLGSVITERFSRLDAMEIPGVLVAHHGPFSWGKTVEEAVVHAAALEMIAELALGTMQLSPQMAPISGILSEKQFPVQT